jgi:seryl-tRNA synthetase
LEDPFEILNDMEETSIKLRNAMAGHARAFTAREEEASQLKAETKALQKKVKHQQATILQQSEELKNHMFNAEQRKRASDQRITELEDKVSDLTEQMKALQSFQAENLVIENRTFVKFGPDNANAGLYVTKEARVVTFGETDYTENIALSQFKNIALGGTLTESVVLEDFPFMRISGGDNDQKLVQDLGAQSIFEHDGKWYVRWFIRTKKPLSL